MQSLSSLSAVSQKSLSSLSAVSQQSLSSISALFLLSFSSFPAVSQLHLSTFSQVSCPQLPHSHHYILRAYFIKPSEHKILRLVQCQALVPIPMVPSPAPTKSRSYPKTQLVPKRQGLTDGRTITLEIRCKVLTTLRFMQIIIIHTSPQ